MQDLSWIDRYLSCFQLSCRHLTWLGRAPVAVEEV
jgi:hypothetical protein